MHLADAFIQSDLHCIQGTVSTFYQLLLSLFNAELHLFFCSIYHKIFFLISGDVAKWINYKLILFSYKANLQKMIMSLFSSVLIW